jgi:hypothetical protein
MSAEPEITLALAYSPLGDVASAQLGGPADVHLARVLDDVVLDVRRDDPGELVGFEVERFGTRYSLLPQSELLDVLGPAVVEQLDRLHGRTADLRERAPQSLDELQGLLDRVERIVVAVPPASAELREARRRAAEGAWEAAADPPSAGEPAIQGLLNALRRWLDLAPRWRRIRDFGWQPLDAAADALPSMPLATRGPEPGFVRLEEVAAGRSAAAGAVLAAIDEWLREWAGELDAMRYRGGPPAAAELGRTRDLIEQSRRVLRDPAGGPDAALPLVEEALRHWERYLTKLDDGEQREEQS